MDNSKLPAYPISITREWKEGNDGHMYEVKDDYEGVSKLELFTMAAMQGLASLEFKSDKVYPSMQHACADLATLAVEFAKATLSELSKHQ